MGSNQDLSSGPGWKDVAAAIEHLEITWEQPVSIRIFRIGSGKFVQLGFHATVLEDHSENGAVLPLVYQSSHMSGSDGGDICAVLLALLYRLDFAIGEARQERLF